jgi:phosphatidylinositol glycan class V
MDKTRPNTQAAEFQRRDWGTLIKCFILWKAILLAVACASPGPGYDSSTQILFDQYDEYEQPARTLLGRGIEHLALRLTRWDGIYFSSSAARGHVNEQDWAFSWALARSTSFLSRGV